MLEKAGIPDRLCLDFVNVRLDSHADLVGWARRAWILGEAEERALFVEGRLHPAPAAKVVRKASDLREAIHRVLSALVEGSEPAAMDLESLSRWTATGAAHRRLTATARGVRWRWVPRSDDLERMLWPVGQSAAELLTADDMRRLRCCGECGRFFLDTTKNGSRRWCGKGCGDRVKARRYYRRLRNTAT